MRVTTSFACICMTRSKANCHRPDYSRWKTPKPVNCWKWIRTARLSAKSSQQPTQSGLQGWIGRSGGPALTHCALARPNHSRRHFKGSLKHAAEGEEGEWFT